MELDKRIIDGKKPLDCFDVDIAKQFIGKKGYFSNYLNVYTNLCNMEEGVLHSLDEQHGEAFVEEYAKWKFFLPAEWVKEPEKKYRPYTLTEFVNTYSLGDEVIMRTKDNSTNRHVLFTEYEEGKGRDDVRLGQYWYTFMILFNNYEIYTGEGWKPFGVEE